MYGYSGKILHIDLTNRKTWVETKPEEWYKVYIGGCSMASGQTSPRDSYLPSPNLWYLRSSTPGTFCRPLRNCAICPCLPAC